MANGVVYRYWRQRGRNGRTVACAPRASPRWPTGSAGRARRGHARGLLGEHHVGGRGGHLARRRTHQETEFEALEEPGFLARTRGRNGGGHVLAVTTKPAPGSPVTRP